MTVRFQQPSDRILYRGLGDEVQFFSPRITVAAAANWWDPNSESLCIWAAYQPKGAANQAASYIDLSGSGHNTGPGVAPTWDAVNGWKFNGTTQYLTTTFVPQNDQSQSVLVQFTNCTNNNQIFGAYDGSSRRIYIIPATVASQVEYANGGNKANAPVLTSGNLAISGSSGYRNGVLDVSLIGAWAGAATVPLWIGCLNVFGIPSNFCAAHIQALAIYDCTLTAPQVAAVAAAMAAL